MVLSALHVYCGHVFVRILLNLGTLKMGEYTSRPYNGVAGYLRAKGRNPTQYTGLIHGLPVSPAPCTLQLILAKNL